MADRQTASDSNICYRASAGTPDHQIPCSLTIPPSYSPTAVQSDAASSCEIPHQADREHSSPIPQAFSPASNLTPTHAVGSPHQSLSYLPVHDYGSHQIPVIPGASSHQSLQGGIPYGSQATPSLYWMSQSSPYSSVQPAAMPTGQSPHHPHLFTFTTPVGK